MKFMKAVLSLSFITRVSSLAQGKFGFDQASKNVGSKDWSPDANVSTNSLHDA